MASLCDLPNEVLAKISLCPLALRSVVLVSHRFYDVFIPKLYEDFDTAITQLPKPHTDRFSQYLWTIFASFRLPKYVKAAHIDFQGRWAIWLCHATGHTDCRRYPQLLSRYLFDINELGDLPPFVTANTPMKEPGIYDALDIVLAHLPRPERARIGAHDEQSTLQLARCTQLKELNLNVNMRTPMRFVTTALGLPALTRLEFCMDRDPVDIELLSTLPLAGSNVQTLVIEQTQYLSSDYAQSKVDVATFFKCLFGSLRTLKQFNWQRQRQQFGLKPAYGQCATHHNARLQPALARFQESLETLVIWPTCWNCDCYDLKEGPLESVRCYPNLKILKLAPEMILNEPRTNVANDISSVAHEIRRPGFFADLLPDSLEDISLYADASRRYRGPKYWSNIIQDILSYRHRFSLLKQITIYHNHIFDSNSMGNEKLCESCSTTQIPCGLCHTTPRTFNAMERLCRDAGIVLSIVVGCPGHYEHVIWPRSDREGSDSLNIKEVD